VTGVIDDMVTNDPAFTLAERADWKTTTAGPNGWSYSERIFQAARFVTEMEYQHLAFEEFARKVQPQVNLFAGYDSSVNSAISAEFAHAVYRFGHSMLNETVARTSLVASTRTYRCWMRSSTLQPSGAERSRPIRQRATLCEA